MSGQFERRYQFDVSQMTSPVDALGTAADTAFWMAVVLLLSIPAIEPMAMTCLAPAASHATGVIVVLVVAVDDELPVVVTQLPTPTGWLAEEPPPEASREMTMIAAIPMKMNRPHRGLRRGAGMPDEAW